MTYLILVILIAALALFLFLYGSTIALLVVALIGICYGIGRLI